MSAPQTIFRFVTVRNPRKPRNDEIASGFVKYDPNVEAPLVTEISQAKASEGALGAMRAAAQRHREGKEFIDSPADLAKLSVELVDFADWVAENSSRLTGDALAKRVEGHDLNVGAPLQRALWDSLLAHTIAGGTPEARELVISALRAINLLEFAKRKPDDSTLRRVANATVLLPSTVQVDPKQFERAMAVEAPPAPEQPTVDRAALRDRLAAYGAAHEELSAHYQTELEKARSAEVAPPRVPTVDSRGCVTMPESRASAGPQVHPALLTEGIYRRVSEPTRSLLESLKIEPGVRLPYVLNQLESQAAAESAKAATGASATTRVVYSGGTVWSYQPLADVRTNWPARGSGGVRVDTEYGGMYGADTCRVKPLGIADFRRVEQEIWCYEPGEVAHIENVLIGETKERKTRMLRRSESIFTTETSEETTKERDTQTTDRFEIQKETEKVVKDDVSFDLGVQVSASYGVVKIQADTKFAISQSTTDSDKESSKYAKDVTDRALERVVKKVREEQVQKLLQEYEETNTHGFDNQAGSAHIVGLYRWVEKIYQAKIVNYGKRLMFEFIVPEPAAFHLYALATAPVDSQLTLEKPLDPRSAEAAQKLGQSQLHSHLGITATNYPIWASAYQAKVDPPPDQYLTVDKAYNRDGMDQGVQFSVSNNEFKIPDGYEATTFACAFGLHSEDDNWITVLVGRHADFTRNAGAFTGTLDKEDDFVPVTVMGKTRMYGLDLEVTCQRKASTFEVWQIKTFQAILKGYDDMYGAYQTALADAKAHTATQPRETNPDLNRQVEQTELKKACIRMLDPHCSPVASEAMQDGRDCGYPEFDCCVALDDGSYVQFVEQAFEWSIMTYLFYPYFWGRKCNWTKLYQLTDSDPLFLGFLQAGYARVVVPVRPGYEAAVLRFLIDGQPWNGGSAPGVDSPLYVSIANEMKEPVGTIDPDVQPWEIRVPTTLTVLQCDSGCVPGSGLPCPHGGGT